MRHSLLFYSFLTMLVGCLEPYQPPAITGEVDIVVVDGFLNSTDSSATVRLSHASALSSTAPPSRELNASVNIEEDNGATYSLNETGQGNYTLNNIILDKTKKYRLHIHTQSDKEYFSDYIGLTETPEVDSITWKPDDQGITIFVNSHDTEGKARYYSWNYEETWEYTASFYSNYKMVNGEALPRAQDDRIWMCWTTKSSTEILLSSSDRLSEDVIRDFPLTFVPGNSTKISRRYSIFVEQRTLTKEAYDFWTQLKKTTENLGGLFDPLPAQVLGNIWSSSDSDEPVLGYFSGGQVSKKRLFIEFRDLPDHLLRLRERAPCQEDDINSIPIADIPTTLNSVLLIDPIYVQGVGIVGYTTAVPRCIDCRLQGGVMKQPDFW